MEQIRNKPFWILSSHEAHLIQEEDRRILEAEWNRRMEAMAEKKLHPEPLDQTPGSYLRDMIRTTAVTTAVVTGFIGCITGFAALCVKFGIKF